MTIRTVLVANRGEIAHRVFRSCAELGISTVAVFVPGDTAHLALADESVPVGSYLDAESIIAAARQNGADAIHPGYGFLSENAEFAKAVSAAGLTFVGPTPEVIELMGRKDRAREVAERAGVPVTPRFDPQAVPESAYPVLVKAAAGGGGKGMHIVREPADLAAALATATREAASAFGDDTLLVEKYVEGGRHVEVQVFGDSAGNVVHLLDRDCSVQRRHQKVVEEAPAPNLSPTVRQRIRQSAVDLCREVGYVNAGTVEYLVLGEDAYFLEMNTRLQVEHPVTEEVTGFDLVQWQLAIADGQRLPVDQAQIQPRGHAVEVRVYAEDPYSGFLPQAGQIVSLHWPKSARIESVVEAGTKVTSAFDPMLAKVITTGPDREDAINQMVTALDQTAVFGLVTNLGFARRAVDSAVFRSATMDTGWLDDAEAEVLEQPTASAELIASAAALLWPNVGDGWRLAADAVTPILPVVDQAGVQHEVTEPVLGDEPNFVQGPRVWLTERGQAWLFERPDGTRRAHAVHLGESEVVSPMPGTVIAVEVAAGDVVQTGQRLGAVEAMKMELALVAPHDGVVTEVATELGAQVKLGDLVFHVEPQEAK